MSEHNPLPALTMAVLLVVAGVAAAAPIAVASHGGDGDVAVETGGATDVTESAAWLHGNLTHLNASDDADLSVEIWEAGDPANSSVYDAGERDEPGEFRVHAKQLDAGTTYAYRARATADETTVNGSVVEFTTAAREIELNVETEAPANVTADSATLVANLTALDANATDTEVRFQYWERGDRSTKVHSDPVAVNDTGPVAVDVANLTADQAYTVRAHAETNATDVNYTADDRGAELTFATFSGEFAVQTLDATDVTNDSATLNGRLEGLNGSANASVGFSYWAENDSANATSVDAGTLDGPGEFSAAVAGLDNGTTYVYVASTQADGANATGERVTFTPGSEAGDDTPTWDGAGPFGQFVSDVVEKFKSEEDADEPLGQWLSDVVRENNPGQGPPAHAGPPENAGPDDDSDDSEDSADDDRGPPEHAGPDSDDNETDDDSGPPERAGPPDNAGPPGNETDDSDSDDSEDSDSDDSDENGPPGGTPGNGPP